MDCKSWLDAGFPTYSFVRSLSKDQLLSERQVYTQAEFRPISVYWYSERVYQPLERPSCNFMVSKIGFFIFPLRLSLLDLWVPLVLFSIGQLFSRLVRLPPEEKTRKITSAKQRLVQKMVGGAQKFMGSVSLNPVLHGYHSWKTETCN